MCAGSRFGSCQHLPAPRLIFCEAPCLQGVCVLSTPPPAPHGNPRDKKWDMEAGVQQCTLALASAAGLYAGQSADLKSLLLASGMVGDMEQGQS